MVDRLPIDEAKSVARDRVYEYRQEHNRNLQKAGQVLKLFTDDTIAPATPFEIVQTKAFAILQRPKLVKVKQGLYGFSHPSQYDTEWLLRPIRKINEKLIIEEWENIQRMIVFLALKKIWLPGGCFR
jgi:hypothetical protein